MAKKKTKVTGARTTSTNMNVKTSKGAGSRTKMENMQGAYDAMKYGVGPAMKTAKASGTAGTAQNPSSYVAGIGTAARSYAPGKYAVPMSKIRVTGLEYDAPKASLVTGNKPDIYNPASKTPNSAKAVMSSRRKRR